MFTLISVISMRLLLLVVISTRLFAFNTYTCYKFYQIEITASLADEDAVYLLLHGGLHICKRVPYCLRGPSMYTRRQKR